MHRNNKKIYVTMEDAKKKTAGANAYLDQPWTIYELFPLNILN